MLLTFDEFRNFNANIQDSAPFRSMIVICEFRQYIIVLRI